MKHEKMKGRSHSTHSMTDNGKGDPDRGPPMQEGQHHFDKGYESDEETFSPRGVYPDDHERGNDYMELKNEICHRDSKKMMREKRTKIS